MGSLSSRNHEYSYGGQDEIVNYRRQSMPIHIGPIAPSPVPNKGHYSSRQPQDYEHQLATLPDSVI